MPRSGFDTQPLVLSSLIILVTLLLLSWQPVAAKQVSMRMALSPKEKTGSVNSPVNGHSRLETDPKRELSGEQNGQPIDPSLGLPYAPGELLIKIAAGDENEAIGSSGNFNASGILAQDPMVKAHGALDVQPVFQSIQGLGKDDSNRLLAAMLDPASELGRWHRATFPADRPVEEIAADLIDSPTIETVELNYIVHAFDLPNDPDLPLQWGLHNLGQDSGTVDADIDAVEAWDISSGSTDVVVAIIDTGIDLDHPDLANNLWKNATEIPGNGDDDDGNGYVDDLFGWDFLHQDNDPQDDQWHGTAVAGIVAAEGNNQKGIAGVSWHSKVMAIKVLGINGAGTNDDIAAGVVYAADNGADIINLSLGGASDSEIVRDAIAYAVAHGSLPVASAGNSATSLAQYPAAFDDVISVAATDRDDRGAHFTNFGEWVDIAAPGASIHTAQYNDKYTVHPISGTSFSAPFVSGVAALLRSVNPSWGPSQLARQIIGSSDYIYESNAGYEGMLGSGRLNAYKALTASETPNIQIAGIAISDAQGNSDGTADPGETIQVTALLKNYWQDTLGVRASLTTGSPHATVKMSEAAFGALPNQSSVANDANPFVVAIDSSTPPGSHIPYLLTISDDSGYTREITVSIPVGTARIQGTISHDTEWLAKDGPFYVTGDIVVDSGATLTIQAGSELIFDDTLGQHQLSVNGTLHVLGTEERPVIFTSLSKRTGDWQGISLSGDAPGGHIIDHTIVEYAGDYAISVWSTAPTITGSVLRHNSGGIQYKEEHGGLLQDSVIYENEGYPIYVGGYTSPHIVNNVVYNHVAPAHSSLYVTSHPGPTFVNNIVNMGIWIPEPEKQVPLVYYNDFWTGTGYEPVYQEGNMEVDPLFSDPVGGDFRLLPTSPLIDAGDPRIGADDGSRSDMGIFGGGVLLAPFPVPPPSAIPLDGKVLLRWHNALGAEGYTAVVGSTSGSDTRRIDVGEILQHEIASLSNGIAYYFGVKSYNDSEESSVFFEVSAAPEQGTYITSDIDEDTTWTAKDSPYIIQPMEVGDWGVALEQDSELVIEPGTTVKFRPDTSLSVRGNLYAIGTSDQSRDIMFTSSGRGMGLFVTGYLYARYVKFQNLEYAVRFSNCIHGPMGENGMVTQSSFDRNKKGIYVQGTRAIIAHNLFTRHTHAVGNGYNGDSEIYSNTFFENDVRDPFWHTPAAISSLEPGYLTVRNNIIVSNTSGIKINDDAIVSIAYNDVWNNATDYEWSAQSGPGDISVDPQFADPQNGDFSLQATSPAIGAGEHGADLGAFPFGDPPLAYTAIVESERGGILNVGDALIQFQANSVPETTTVTYSREPDEEGLQSAAEPPQLIREPFQLEASSQGVEVTRLDLPAIVVIQLDRTAVNSQDSTILSLYRWNETDSLWLRLSDSTYNARIHRVQATTSELGRFAVMRETLPDCHPLTLSHTGMGSDPIADPANSIGCDAGKYEAGETVQLSASPNPGWAVIGWSGTDNDASPTNTNMTTMPNHAHEVLSHYEATSATGLFLPIINGD